MSTSGKCVIPPDVGELAQRSPAEKAPQDLNATSRSTERALDTDTDSEYVVPDQSFLMVLLRALSAWPT